jgi:hypothetical protein
MAGEVEEAGEAGEEVTQLKCGLAYHFGFWIANKPLSKSICRILFKLV